MPATHSFSLTPKASKLVTQHKYRRELGGASKMVSNAIEFYFTERSYVSGPVYETDRFEQDPITLACVNCGATYPKRAVANVGEMMANIMALQDHLTQANQEIEELKNRKKWWKVWQRKSGLE